MVAIEVKRGVKSLVKVEIPELEDLISEEGVNSQELRVVLSKSESGTAPPRDYFLKPVYKSQFVPSAVLSSAKAMYTKTKLELNSAEVEKCTLRDEIDSLRRELKSYRAMFSLPE